MQIVSIGLSNPVFWENEEKLETICMKCQILFSGKNISICRQLKILPRVLSVNYFLVNCRLSTEQRTMRVFHLLLISATCLALAVPAHAWGRSRFRFRGRRIARFVRKVFSCKVRENDKKINP